MLVSIGMKLYVLVGNIGVVVKISIGTTNRASFEEVIQHGVTAALSVMP
jgi:hypothetical protein